MIGAGVAVAAPWAAPRVAGLLLAFVAGAYVVTRFNQIIGRLPATDDRPLVPAPAPRAGTPADLTMLTTDLTYSRPAHVLSPTVTTCLRDLAAVRLREHHDLDVGDPFAAPHIRALVSDDLWAVLVRGPSAARIQRPRYRTLSTLIDEVERL